MKGFYETSPPRVATVGWLEKLLSEYPDETVLDIDGRKFLAIIDTEEGNYLTLHAEPADKAESLTESKQKPATGTDPQRSPFFSGVNMQTITEMHARIEELEDMIANPTETEIEVRRLQSLLETRNNDLKIACRERDALDRQLGSLQADYSNLQQTHNAAVEVQGRQADRIADSKQRNKWLSEDLGAAEVRESQLRQQNETLLERLKRRATKESQLVDFTKELGFFDTLKKSGAVSSGKIATDYVVIGQRSASNFFWDTAPTYEQALEIGYKEFGIGQPFLCKKLSEETLPMVFLPTVFKPTAGTPETDNSILQPWVTRLGRRHQGVLLGAVRGCDGIPKGHPSRLLVRFLRGEFLVPFSQGETRPKSFMITRRFSDAGPDLKQAMSNALATLEELPVHYVMHLAGAAQIVGLKQSGPLGENIWWDFYVRLCKMLHVTPETEGKLDARLNADEETFAKSQQL